MELHYAIKKTCVLIQSTTLFSSMLSMDHFTNSLWVHYWNIKILCCSSHVPWKNDDMARSKFYTYHDSLAVISCACVWPDGIKIKTESNGLKLCAHKPFVKLTQVATIITSVTCKESLMASSPNKIINYILNKNTSFVWGDINLLGSNWGLFYLINPLWCYMAINILVNNSSDGTKLLPKLMFPLNIIGIYAGAISHKMHKVCWQKSSVKIIFF